MRAAVLSELGTVPRHTDFPDPEPVEGQLVVEVGAAGVHHLDLAKASGTFYAGAPTLPSVVGSDGVGRTADGRRVYFDASVTPYGSWAERTLVALDGLLEPHEGIDDATAAALGNTGMAAWLTLSWRADLQPGESVLVLGANGALGSVAVQAAKVLGAGLVVAADRDPERLLRARERGADATVTLQPGVDAAAELRTASGGRGFDVIVDPLWGEPGLAALRAAAHGARHVQLGQLAGLTVELPAPAVRSVGLNLLGFAVFHAPLEVRRAGYRDLTEQAAVGAVVVDLETVPLGEVEAAWARQSAGPGRKLVLIP